MELKLKKPEIEQYIDEQVKLGRFPTPEAVVEDALLRAMNAHEELTDEDFESIQISQEQLARGEGIDAAEVATQIRKLYDSHRT